MGTGSRRQAASTDLGDLAWKEYKGIARSLVQLGETGGHLQFNKNELFQLKPLGGEEREQPLAQGSEEAERCPSPL